MMSVATTLYAQNTVVKQSLCYAEREHQQLFLDHYMLDKSDAKADDSVESLRPCLIFVFGGGFAGGERDNEAYLPFFEAMVRGGVDVVSIDYRLGLRMLAGIDGDVRMMVGALRNAVDIAVQDLYTATNYVVEHSEAWNINPRQIILCGSSAGAITALQAEWGRCIGSEAAQVLPEEFRYGGVIACAGAIFSTSGRPKWSGDPAPIMLFHGTSDSNVPYNRASMFGVGFYGSEYIAEQLDKLGSPYYFYSVAYADHSIAITPLIEQSDLILQFVDEYVVRGSQRRTIAEVVVLNGTKGKTRFSVMDYLQSNYAR